MAMLQKREQTAAQFGISAEQVKLIRDRGGSIVIPPEQSYIRLGAIGFPCQRAVVLTWEIWPDKASSQKLPRDRQCETISWVIRPEPQVLEVEQRDADGNVLSPALILPTYDEFASMIVEAGDRVSGAMDGIRDAAYRLAMKWPGFAGSELA